MAAKSAQEKLKILCIDKESSLYQEVLARREIELSVFQSFDEGIQHAQGERQDVLFCDYSLLGEKDKPIADYFLKNGYPPPFVILLLPEAFLTPNKWSEIEWINEVDDFIIKPLHAAMLMMKLKLFRQLMENRNLFWRYRRKLKKALTHIHENHNQLKKIKQVLKNEKALLHNSLQQTAMLIRDRDERDNELETLKKQIEGSYDGFVGLLGTLIDQRPRYNRGHAGKMAKIAGFIASQMRLADNHIKDIETASLLHEIGKVAVPDGITRKHPRDYTGLERNMLIQHPTRGAALLTPCAGMERIAKMIRHLHENVDGSGFPDGLKWDEIPLGSRIMAIANIFENLYHREKEMTADKVIAIIEENAGVVYDARLLNYLHQYIHKHPLNGSSRTLELGIYELKPGMTISAGIYTSTGAKLLSANTVLSETAIHKLFRYHKVDPIEETVFIKE